MKKEALMRISFYRPAAWWQQTPIKQCKQKATDTKIQKLINGCLMRTLYMWFPASWHRWWLRGYLAGRPRQGGHPIHSVVSLPQGLPRRTPERTLGTNIVMALLVPVGQWRILTALKWCYKIRQWSLPGAAIVPVLKLAVESSGLNWMIKLSWTAMLCSGGHPL